mgnify:CR=1 FL=1
MRIQKFIDYLLLEKKYSPQTVVAYQKDIEAFQLFLTHEFTDTEVSKANYSQIRSWIVQLVDRTISNRTINRKISSLNSYYKFLLKTESIKANPLVKHKALKVSKKIQIPFSETEINYDTPMFMAEIASTFCEEYAFDKILENSSDKEKLGLYMQKIGDSISTISRQIAAYNFEREIHDTFRERGYLSRDEIGHIFKKHMSAYMGSAVLQNYGAENWWMYWSHFRSPFYVYSYASGLLIANGMRAIVRKNPERWSEVKKFFYTGTSKSPEQVFTEMGIDISDKDFWQGGMNEVKKLLLETKKLAKKLKKI